MGRERRVEYEGAIYHVIQRGNNRNAIFEKDIDKHYLLKKLRTYKEKAGYMLFGYVIMNNHYHLILQTIDQPLNKVMHLINNSYSKYYNFVRKRSGHVFEGRYKANLVQDERYALALLRYVHQNPVRAGLCKYVWQYHWSSDVYYRKNLDTFVDTDLILDLISTKRVEAVRQYNQLIGKEGTKDWEIVNHGKILDDILLETGVTPQDYELIKNGSRKRSLTPFKVAYAKKAMEYNYNLSGIAENINLSKSALCRLMQ
ncbi:MAG: transposase [Firmicutes bacterium]|nr:transposase [Bacillota bacterium]